MSKTAKPVPRDPMIEDAGTEAGTLACYFDVGTMTGYGDDELLASLSEDERELYKGLGRVYPIVLSPQMTVLKYVANPFAAIGPHHHGVNQLIYILRGELRMGTKTLKPGMGYYHPSKKYSWKAGAEGADFIEVYSGYPSSPITS